MLTDKIKEIFDKDKKRIGSPRITKKLQNNNEWVTTRLCDLDSTIRENDGLMVPGAGLEPAWRFKPTEGF